MSVAQQLGEWLPLLWSFAAVVAVVALFASGVGQSLLRRVTKFGGFGLSFEFDAKSAKETRASIENTLGGARKTIRRELAAEVRARGLQEAFASVIRDTSLRDHGDGKSYRATLHIPDPLFKNQLFQLLDYHPQSGGAGRSRSSRDGIIGLAWRTEKMESWTQTEGVTHEELVSRWAMTHQGATSRVVDDASKAFLAFPLRSPNDSVPIAVFYLDDLGNGHERLLPKLAGHEELRDKNREAVRKEKEKNAIARAEVKKAKAVAASEDAASSVAVPAEGSVTLTPEETALVDTRTRFELLADEIAKAFTTHMAKATTELVENAKRNSPQLDLEAL